MVRHGAVVQPVQFRIQPASSHVSLKGKEKKDPHHVGGIWDKILSFKKKSQVNAPKHNRSSFTNQKQNTT
jgi:hypothetical protein